MIETLIENTSINVTAFPGGGQLKKALSPYQAFIKLAHWLRQGVFDKIGFRRSSGPDCESLVIVYSIFPSKL